MGLEAGRDCRRAEGVEVEEEEEEGVGVGGGVDCSFGVVVVGVVVAGVAIGRHSHSWRREHCALVGDVEEAGEETRSSRLAEPGHGRAEAKRHSRDLLAGAEEDQEGVEAAGG